MPNLLTAHYWFNPLPVPFQPGVERALAVLFGAFLFLSVFLWLVTMRHGLDKDVKKGLRRVAEAAFWLGLFGWVLFGLTYQRIYGLGMRFGYVLWLALFAWELWRLGRYFLVDVPARRTRAKEMEEKDKWMPKTK